jgi:hypothetical protein
LLTFLIGLLYLLRPRPPRALAGEEAPVVESPPPHIRRVRRFESLALVVGGLVLIAVTLGTGDDSAQALPPAAPVDTVQEQEALPARVEAPTTQTLANPSDKSIPVTVLRSYPFVWPADGPITSEIGPWHPLGIDIGFEYDVDSPIRASARGTVTFAGGTVGEDYGYHVIIDHGGGLVTLYGHMSEVAVQEGQFVKQGEFLGLGGDTGKAQGKHLHFEVKYNGSQINPLEVLPAQGASAPEPLPVDCAKEALVIDSGAPAVLDFGQALPSGTLIGDTHFEAVNASGQALPSSVARESDRTVLLDTSPTVKGTGEDDEYALKVMPAAADQPELVCSVFVKTRSVRTVFYVRPTSTPVPPTAEEATVIPPTSTPTNTPTATPTPTKTPRPARGAAP